jgi:hypothetical protein
MLNKRIIELEDKIATILNDPTGARIDKALLMHQYRAQAEAIKAVLIAIEE